MLNKSGNFTVEIPGYTLSWIAMNKIGRRWALAGSLLMCAFTCVLGGFVHHGMYGATSNEKSLNMNLSSFSHFISCLILFYFMNE